MTVLWQAWLIAGSHFILSIFFTRLFSPAATLHLSEELKCAFIFKFSPCDQVEPVTHLPTSPNHRQGWVSTRTPSVYATQQPLCGNAAVSPGACTYECIYFLLCPLCLASDSFHLTQCLVSVLHFVYSYVWFKFKIQTFKIKLQPSISILVFKII